MTAKFTVLGNTTLATSSASVTFSSIPGGHKDLVLVVSGTTTANADCEIQVNNLTTSIYNQVGMYGDGSSAASASTTGTLLKVANEARFTSSSVSSCIVNFFDYSATDKHKSVLSRANSPSIAVEAVAGRIATTAAITEIDILAQGQSWAAGSTFRLLGVN